MTARSFLNGKIEVHAGDCLDTLRTLADASIDSVVTDPPYALVSIQKRFGKEGSAPAQYGKDGAYARASSGFMGKQWDTGERAFSVEFWAEVLRALKPGGHCLAFGGSRTYHRMVCAIEDAGFEIRDQIMWLYGSGFPKSHDVSKGIDKRKDWTALPKLQHAIRAARTALRLSQSEAARRMGLIGPGERLGGGGFMWFETGIRAPTREQWPRLKEALAIGDEFDACFEEVEREITGVADEWIDRSNYAITSKDGFRRDKPASAAARRWAGWGTALKPAHEDIVLARKPFDLEALSDNLARELMEALCQLSSLANVAGEGSPSSRSALSAVEFGFVQWSAVAACNTPADLFDLMATWRLKRPIPTSLNIASLWLAILAEISAHASTFTTETASSLITDLRTLNCSQLRITPATIIEVASGTNGIGSSASLVDRNFNALAERLRLTRALSALAPATLTDALADLRPKHTPVVLARKPLAEGTVAQNVLAHGTGAINVDGCRVEGLSDKELNWTPQRQHAKTDIDIGGARPGQEMSMFNPKGRWPANVIHDGSEEVVGAFPDNAGGGSATPCRPRREGSGWDRPCNDRHDAAKQAYDGQGSAARFFYQVKPDPVLEQSQRSASSDLEHESHRLNSGFDSRDGGQSSRLFYTAKADTDDRLGSKHPTIKPLDLMQYLIRLVTPKGGVVLDPFAGSGTTGEAAVREGCRAILCEREPEYLTDIERRCALILAGPDSRRHATLKTKGKVEDAGPLFGALA
jgi:DNA modification methylase/transcriptional regulator with XRE-family HTH domain